MFALCTRTRTRTAPPLLRLLLRPITSSSPTTSKPPATTTTSAPPTPATPLPYFIHRSKTGYLPVYQSTKVGGTKKETKIRKTEGNIAALREDLIRELKLDPGRIYVNNLTKHVVLKGHLKREVTGVLEGLSF